MTSLLIVNKYAGQHRSGDPFEQIREAFGADIPEIALTESHGHAAEIAQNAALSGKYDILIAAGGDGTVNEVATGLLDAGLGDSTPALGVIPIGTCNVLATELSIPWPNIPEAVDVIRNGSVKRIDVGRADNRYFLLMASVGIDALAVQGVFAPLKNLVGPGAYIVGGLTALATFNAIRLRLRLDNNERFEMDAYAAVIANVSTYGFSSVSIAPFASVDDGWLDICVFEKPPMQKIGFLGMVMLALARRHLGDPRVRYFRCRSVEIFSDPVCATQIDGDRGEGTPLKISVIPHALPVIVPRN